jgi:hypothetical protein
MDTKTIEQVNVLKADALSIIVLKEVKMIWHIFSGRAGMTDVGFLYAGSAGVAILGGDTAMRVC